MMTMGWASGREPGSSPSVNPFPLTLLLLLSHLRSAEASWSGQAYGRAPRAQRVGGEPNGRRAELREDVGGLAVVVFGDEPRDDERSESNG